MGDPRGRIMERGEAICKGRKKILGEAEKNSLEGNDLVPVSLLPPHGRVCIPQ